MIRCRKCGRQLKSAESQVGGLGRYCAGKPSHTSQPRAQRPGDADQPSLFDEPLSIQEAMKGGPWENLGDVVDFDALRGKVADSKKAE